MDKRINIVSLYAFIVAIYLFFWAYPAAILHVTGEDGVIESFGAICFLLASLFFMVMYLNSQGDNADLIFVKTNRNIFYLLLGVFCFVCFGEEISWGQRIFGWESPEVISNLNAQNETNLHNMWFFHIDNPDGSRKDFWDISRMFHLGRLFNMFWFGYCFILPVVCYIFPKVRNIVKNIGLPLIPLWLGILFFVNYLVYKSIVISLDGLVNIEGAQPGEFASDLDELKESMFGFLYLVFAFTMFYKIRISNKVNSL